MQSETIRRKIAVVLLAFVTAGFIAWPIPFYGASITWGSQWDLWNNLWFFDYIRHSITNLDFSMYTQSVFFPIGYDLRFDLAHFMVPLAAAPLQFLGNPVIAYNCLLIFLLAFNGYAGFLLMRHLTAGDIPGAALGAVIWALSPLVFADMYVGSIELTACGVIPFAILAFLHLRETSGKWAYARASATLALACLTNWLFGAFVILALAIVIPSYRNLAGLRRWCIAGAGALFICLPIIIMVIKDNLVEGHLRLDLGVLHTQDVSRDRDTVRPPIPLTDLSRRDFMDMRCTEVIADSIDIGKLYTRKSFRHPSRAFPRPIVILIGVISVCALLPGHRKDKWGVVPMAQPETVPDIVPPWRWMVLGLIALVLSLGPFLQMSPNKEMYFGRFPLPYFHLYQHVPFFAVFNRPHRFITVFLLALAVLSALGLKRITSRLKNKRHGVIVAIILTLITGVDFAITKGMNNVQVTTIAVPAIYNELARDPERYGVIELPCAPLPVQNYNAQYAFYQTVHRKFTYNMTLLRSIYWEKAADFARNNKFFSQLLLYPAFDAASAGIITPVDIADFRALGFRYILVHTDMPSPKEKMDEFCDWLAKFCGEGVAYPGNILLYDLRTIAIPSKQPLSIYNGG